MALTPLEAVKWGFALVLTVNFVLYARSGKARRHLTVFARRSPKEWGIALACVALEVACVLALIVTVLSLGQPLLNWSWLLLLATPADGERPATNLMAAPASFPWFGAVFLVLLLFNVPRLVRREEEIFRRGTRDWKDALPRSVKFGLVHMVVGVPVGVALVLIGSGLFFTWRYFVGGVREASFYHSLHNLILLVGLGLALAFG